MITPRSFPLCCGLQAGRLALPQPSLRWECDIQFFSQPWALSLYLLYPQMQRTSIPISFTNFINKTFVRAVFPQGGNQDPSRGFPARRQVLRHSRYRVSPARRFCSGCRQAMAIKKSVLCPARAGRAGGNRREHNERQTRYSTIHRAQSDLLSAEKRVNAGGALQSAGLDTLYLCLL